MSTKTDSRTFLRALFDTAVSAADPMRRIPETLPDKPDGEVIVIGAGKASARMAEAVESVWGPCKGLVITRDGYARPTQGIEIVEASHPVPDLRGQQATRRMLDLLRPLDRTAFVLALISGGGSALMIDPAGDITLGQKQRINEQLLASGAPIDQMNIVRKHLSRVKGGQLAATTYPAKMLSLMISDVPGDDPAFIASGPTVGDATRASEARAILDRYAIRVPEAVDAVLKRPSGVVPPTDKRLSSVENRIISAPSQSLEAAADMSKRLRVIPSILGDALEGEARELAAKQGKMALEIRDNLKPGDRPILLLSGGECTVTRKGNGIGGPNAEFALALAIALDGAKGIAAIACDTDGVDGADEVAGAFIDHATLERARSKGVDPQAALDRNDAHSFFKATGDSIITGPTLTNVNDFRAILVVPPRA